MVFVLHVRLVHSTISQRKRLALIAL
jgi:hypothetical protein